MNFILDTHTLLWFFGGDARLTQKVRNILDDPTEQKLISLASVWEMAIKSSQGKLSLKLPLSEYINQKIALEDFDLLNINLEHLGVVATLPFHHKDPFDRLIIAQGLIENFPILSGDTAFDAYQIHRLW